ncbi:roadblock/LC7 domain-containing protein [Streptomyces mangrovi]|uniref:roadblock/LC7 domain-containing protein n=1 Tax=Streptomyces mangrovi TaxID=1206892 RepID=UPI00399CA9BA
MRRALKQRAGVRQPAAADPEVLRELRMLRSRVPHLTGALAVGAGGVLLAEDAPGTRTGALAALTATALADALRLAETADRGRFRELLVRGERGYVAAYAAGPATFLAVLAEPRANVGRVHLEARRTGARIARLAAGTDERPQEG